MNRKVAPYLVLATNIPDSEANILIFYSLNIETCKNVNTKSGWED